MQFQINQLEKTKSVRTISFGPMTTRVVLVAFFAVLLLLYLAQSTQGATRQYDVRNLEDSLATAQQDREALKLESIRLQSLNTVMPAPQQIDPKNVGKNIPAETGDALAPAKQIVVVPTTSH